MAYISKKNRELVRLKFNGKCAYSGTDLDDDWQIDHVKPLRREWWGRKKMLHEENHVIENMLPTQRVINKYKGTLSLEDFRKWYLGGLSERLKTLPKNPRAEKSIRRKKFLLKVAEYFGITEDKPFSGTFYFEQISCVSCKWNQAKWEFKCEGCVESNNFELDNE